MGKKRRGRGYLLFLLLMTILVLAGCGKKKGGDIVATLGEEEIGLPEAVFYTRMNQLQWEQDYVEELGENFWNELTEGGELTYGEELKALVMDTICQTHLLNAHAEEYEVALTEEDEAKIKERVSSFMDTYGKNVKKQAGANKKLLEELLREQLLADKVMEIIKTESEPEINEEETSLGKMTYCLFSTLGTYDLQGGRHEVTEDEGEAIWEEAWNFASRAKELGDITAAAKEIGHTSVDVYFNEYTNGGAHEKVAERGRRMGVGQIDGPIETEEGYYVIQCITRLDEGASEEYRETLRVQGKEEKAREIYEGWKSQTGFVINQEVWDQVEVNEVLFVK